MDSDEIIEDAMQNLKPGEERVLKFPGYTARIFKGSGKGPVKTKTPYTVVEHPAEDWGHFES